MRLEIFFKTRVLTNILRPFKTVLKARVITTGLDHAYAKDFFKSDDEKSQNSISYSPTQPACYFWGNSWNNSVE